MEDADLRLQFSVSATNRAPRKGETDGVNYHFLTTEDFQRLISENAFVEYEEVYPGSRANLPRIRPAVALDTPQRLPSSA